VDVSDPGQAAHLLMVGSRVAGALLLAPIFGSSMIPLPVRVVVAALLGWVLAMGVPPLAGSTSPDTALGMAGVVAAERAVGALLEQPESAKVMAEISASAWSSADRRRLLDAWRTPLRYLGPQHSPDRVAINDGRPIFVSAGPDREFGERGSVAVGDNIASDDAGVYDATEGNRVQPQ